MTQITRELKVDVARINDFQAVFAKQADLNSRFLKVTLTDEGNPIFVPQDSTVLINAFRHTDNASNSFLGTVNEDGTVTLPLTAWILEKDGRVSCDISIIDSNYRRLTTTLFTLNVERTACSDDDISQDEHYPIIIQILSELADINSQEAARREAEAQRQAAELQRIAAEEARQAAEEIRTRSDLNYVHTQGVASAEWNITHNLQKFPAVTVVDSAGTVVVGEVTYLDQNSLKVTFSAEFSGKAYCN